MVQGCEYFKAGDIDGELGGEFAHPGILHTADDLERIKGYVNGNDYPPMGSYVALRSQKTASSMYQMQGPFEYIARDGENSHTKIPSMEDSNAAYQNALLWAITGDSTHAEKAVEIINAYSETLKGITGTNDNALIASLQGFTFVNAAEILRYTYPAWKRTDIERAESMFRDIFYRDLMDSFFNRPAYTNGNWGTAATKALMAFGIFLEDTEMFQQAVDFFYSEGEDNGSLANYIINETGQSQESGRDQPHVMFGIGSLAEACEVGYHQGLDMYGALDNRLLKGYEYTAKYNLGHEVPYVQWSDVTGKYSNWSEISPDGRGQFRAVFEIAYNHYVNRKGMEMPWTQQVLEETRPELAPFHNDNPGFGTLLFYLGETNQDAPALGAWDYQFATDGDSEGWTTVQNGSSFTVVDGRLKVDMTNVGAAEEPVYRADIRVNSVILDPTKYPIWAIQFSKPGNSRLTLDTNRGSYASRGTVLEGTGDMDVYYWDLTTKFTQLTTFDYMQLKIADMTTGDPSYEVEWIKTFPSVEALEAYIAE
ncbi:hypothetical protein DN752_03175 [Echinicola strongylocentroti]|uniref:Alginate lyase domain-containing protein n=2 Tax=Echinicola strongylocentroti TaxID=1795355 RepID=A0A2Z4IDU2_9BACT|nr:hypothetical protein DN752_03175 [Echinicola strongylocentroti]